MNLIIKDDSLSGFKESSELYYMYHLVITMLTRAYETKLLHTKRGNVSHFSDIVCKLLWSHNYLSMSNQRATSSLYGKRRCYVKLYPTVQTSQCLINYAWVR